MNKLPVYGKYRLTGILGVPVGSQTYEIYNARVMYFEIPNLCIIIAA